MEKEADSIKIKIEKHRDRYVAYPAGLEDVIRVEGYTRREAVAKAKAAITHYLDAAVEDVSSEYPRHVLNVMGVVRDKKGQVLLVKNSIVGWQPPSGQVENGEDAITALERVISEASGIKIEVEKLKAIYTNPIAIPTHIILTFEAKKIGGKRLLHGGNPVVGWFSSEEAVETVAHPIHKHKLQDALMNTDNVIYRVYGTDPYKLISTTMI